MTTTLEATRQRRDAADTVLFFSAGRYDRGVGAWHEVIQDSANDWDWDLAAGTEAVPSLRPAWDVRGVLRNVAGDALVAHDREHWGRLFSETDHVGMARGREVWASTEVLVDLTTGDIHLNSSIHLRAGVQDRDRWTSPKSAKEWLSALRGWRKHIRKVRRRARLKGHPVKYQTLSADWNLDLHRKRWRVLLRTQFPNLALAVPAGCKEGTHHHRHIDATLHSRNLRMVFLEVLPQTKASDHRPYVVGFRRVKIRRKR